MRSQLRSRASARPRRVILKRAQTRYGAEVSSGEYRVTRPGAEGPRAADDVAGGAPVARMPLSSPAIELPPLAEDDLALTRAPTEPLPADVVAQIATRAVGTDPPPVRTRLPPPSVAPASVRATTPPPGARATTPPPSARTITAPVAARTNTAPVPDAPGARMVTFGDTTLLLVPAGDRLALVIPGVVRITGTRDEALALAQALALPPKR